MGAGSEKAGGGGGGAERLYFKTIILNLDETTLGDKRQWLRCVERQRLTA